MTDWRFRRPDRPTLIAGPCVVEGLAVMRETAGRLAELGDALGIPVCFKASFDKANRSRPDAARGPGIEQGLATLEQVRRETGLPVLTDVHEVHQVGPVAAVADVLQVPAFLCRQTDLLVACGGSGRPVNIKKGQWMDPAGMAGAVEKVRSSSGGAVELAVTERGTFFGYGDLVVDMRGFDEIRRVSGAAVVFDATHSVQRPGRGAQGSSGGNRAAIPALALAAAAAGVDGFFIETHPEPAKAASDAETQWPLAELPALLRRLLRVWLAAREP
ncbi:MAG: 3-deoxy-8-phosphooctulonate synthase [Gemmatimonadetes bacterium]|nr:3-deoxy-8-phosphooctulonate synthase [Gemmatimonadota bacterium]